MSESRVSKSTGRLIAATLAGAWRESAHAENLSEAELATVAPLLHSSGAAGLAWWRIRHSPLAASPAGLRLHDAYRQLRLAALVSEQEIEHVLSLLRAVEIEPILVKGWAIARLYPDRGLRPHGDIDLCVRPEDFARAEAALKCLANVEGHYVDLHSGFAKLTGESWDELYQGTQLVSIGNQKLRVLSAEDHLRVLCLHLLSSGAWRPLWLCDVALALESRTADFDWARCLGRNELHADWVACVIGLAHELLGADLEDIPELERAKRLPRWLVPAVLRQWSRCSNPSEMGLVLPNLLKNLLQPEELFRHIYTRWDQPIRATIELQGSFNEWPRLPYQLGAWFLRSPELFRQLPILAKR